MTVKSRAQLNADADTFVNDNTAGDISAEDVRQRVKDLADSAVIVGETETVSGDKTFSGSNDFTNAPTVGGTNSVYHRGEGLQQQLITLQDDEATAVTLPANCNSQCLLALTTANQNTGVAIVWFGISLNQSLIVVQSGSNYEILNGTVLTGTSGNDLVITVGIANNTMYIENRIGAQRIFSLTFFANR